MKKYSDIISGAVLFVLAAVYYAMATQIKQYNSGLPGIVTSDFIPKVYGVAVMVLSAILIFRGIRDLKKARAQEAGEPEEASRFPIDPAIVLVFLLLVIYVACWTPWALPSCPPCSSWACPISCCPRRSAPPRPVWRCSWWPWCSRWPSP